MKISTFFPFFKKQVPYFLFAALIASCAKPPDFPIEPEIEFVDVSKDTMQRSCLDDEFLFAIINFTDGDGDIGSDSIFYIDSRDEFTKPLGIPEVPELGASNGIKGKITFKIVSSQCISFPDSLFLDECEDEYPPIPYDKVVYSIFLKDRAGNKSNIVQTSPVYIRCFD